MTDLVFDANSLYARAWYATCRDYINANMVLRSALQTVFSLINQNVDRIGKPIDRVLFCWDGKHGRDKGDRQVKPTQYYEARELLQELLTELLGAAHATPPENEADDAVASAVEQSKATSIYVVSGDKDLMQLYAEGVYYYCLNTRALLSRSWVTSKFGVKHPRQIAIAQAVIGDKIDNVPGIHGWGPAKVKMLFKAVTPEMNFSEALEAVERQIPESLLEAFYSSLERTLLDPTLKNIPAPAPLNFVDMDYVIDCGVNGIDDAYSRMVFSYSAPLASRAPQGDMNEYD